MTPARVVAAAAALASVLLVQATVVGPVAGEAAASLPAVLVAAVALTDGVGTGLAFGFVTGLLADLGSQHPAGVLALCWLALGIGCGLARDRRARLRRDAAVAGTLATVAALLGNVAVALLPAGGTVSAVPHDGGWALLANVILALLVVPLVRLFLRSDRLRRPEPVLLLGGAE